MLLLSLLTYFILVNARLLGIVLQKLWTFWQSPLSVSGICGFVKLLFLRQTGVQTEDLPPAVTIAPGFARDTGQII